MNLSLCIESWRSFPQDGWIVNGEKVLPPNAYLDEYDWIVNLRHVYPDRIEAVLKKIDKYKRDSTYHAWLVRHAAFKLIARLNREYT